MDEEPPILYSDGVPPVTRDRPDELFYLRILATPLPDSEEFGEVGGAYVNCYVDADDLRSAELRAIEMVRRNGWRSQRLEAWKLTSDVANGASPTEAGDEVQKLIDQAREEGEACVLYCWPVDAPDANDPAA